MTSEISQSRVDFLSSSFEGKAQAYGSEVYRKMDQVHQLLKDFQQSLEKLSDEQKTVRLEDLVAQTRAVVSHCDQWKQAENILRSLHYTQISERRSDIKVAHRQTFSWSLSEEKTSLGTWLREEKGIFWIKGKAGSGKSTLMKYLMGDQEPRTRMLLEEWAQGQELLMASHFFWGPGTKLQCDINGLFRALLFQILLQYPQLIHEVCPKRAAKGTFQYLESWTTEELHTCFTHLSGLPRLPAKICLFIDGLDEFHGDLNDLVSLIQALACSDSIKICVASRPWVQFHEAFGQIKWQLRVENLTGEDIRTYVQDNLCGNKRFVDLQRNMTDKADFLKHEIANRADGVFLWVYLVTRNLLRGLTNADGISTLIERLDQFPLDLEEYFMAMLMSIEDIYYTETSALLRMLQYSPTSQLRIEVVWAYRHVWKIVEEFKQSWQGLPAQSSVTLDDAGFQVFFERIAGIIRYEPLLKTTDQLTYIASSCKDLIHVSPSDERGLDSQKVGFLHRSVADFLSLPRASAVLNDRLAKDFDVRIALCEAYLLLYYQKIWLHNHGAQKAFDMVDADRLLLLMLYLIQQSQVESWESSETMILLLSAAFYMELPSTDHKQPGVVGLSEDLRSLQRFRLLVGHCCGTWTNSAQIHTKFSGCFGFLMSLLDLHSCRNPRLGESRLLDGLLHDKPFICMLDPLPTISCDLGEPTANMHSNCVDIDQLLEALKHCTVGNALNTSFHSFLLREKAKVQSRRRPVVNFMAICEIMISFGVPQIMETHTDGRYYANSGLPRVDEDLGETIWEILRTDCDAQNVDILAQYGISSLAEVQAMWPGAPLSQDISQSTECSHGEQGSAVVALARKWWSMLPGV
ncbi:hypothetical protein HJFPF1_12627 [Paramyrothecium foliicola]|nr:hypothetical protein HJFPF1_12627 [Paramyrothecium foliicola]